MDHRTQLRFLFHGAVVLFVSLVCGIPYALAIAGGRREATVRAWQLAQVGLAAGGVALVAGTRAVLRAAGNR